MPSIILTQRHLTLNKKSVPTRNYNYAMYIATRDGVMKSANQEHGMFGSISMEDAAHFKNPQDIARLIYRHSSNKTIMYRDILSFTPESAAMAGLETAQDWKRYTEKHILTIADGNKIKHQNLEWVAAVHEKKGQPHIHIILWDKSKEVRNPFTSPKVISEMRKTIIKDTYASQISKFIETKNLVKQAVQQISDDIVDAYEKYLHITADKSLVGLLENGKLDKLLLPRENLEQLAQLNKNFIETIPRKGRLAYSYLPQEGKDALDSIVRYAVYSCPELASMKNRLVDAQISNASLYSSDDLAEKRQQFGKKVDKDIANRIIKLVKCEANTGKTRTATDYAQEKYNQNSAQHLVLSIASCLNTMSQTNTKGESPQKSRNLSKSAKKELARRNEDKGYER